MFGRWCMTVYPRTEIENLRCGQMSTRNDVYSRTRKDGGQSGVLKLCQQVQVHVTVILRETSMNAIRVSSSYTTA